MPASNVKTKAFVIHRSGFTDELPVAFPFEKSEYRFCDQRFDFPFQYNNNNNHNVETGIVDSCDLYRFLYHKLENRDQRQVGEIQPFVAQ